jgi:two-component system sensor histidine kinase/response regulator
MTHNSNLSNLEAQNQQLWAEIERLTQENQALETVQSALADSEARWQLVLQGTNDGIWDWNIRTGEVFVSWQWQTMLGYSSQSLYLHQDTWFDLLHPQDRARVEQAINSHLNHSNPHYEVEFRLLCQDGTYKWILSRGQALWDSVGMALRMAGSHTDISDRKTEQTFLRSLIDNIPDLIFYKDCQGFYKNWNRAFEQCFGQPAQEIVNKTDFDLFSWEKASLYQAQDELIKKSLQSQNFEEWVTHADGNDYLFDTLKTPLIAADGELLGVIGICRDITQRQHRADFLQRQADKENFLSRISRILIDQEGEKAISATLATLGQFTASDRCHIIRYSPCQSLWSMTHEWRRDNNLPSFKNFTQNLPADRFPWYSEQLLMGNALILNQLSDIPEEAIAERQAFLENSSSCLLVVPMITRSKTVGYLGVEASPDKVWQAEEVNLLNFVGELIAIAQQRQEAESALRESEARFAGILDNANEAILAIDEEQRITLFNHAAEQTFGYTASEILGQPLSRLMPNRLQSSYQRIIAAFQAVKKSARQWGQQRPIYGARRDGIEFLGEISLSKLHLNSQTVITAIVRDITQRALAEEALRKAKETADEANRAKSDFLASMSHELRTPLNAIIGFAQVLQRDRNLSTPHQQSVEIISRSGEHLLELINDILEMSKIEAGRTTFNSSHFDLFRLLDNLEKMFRLKADSQGIELIFERSASVPRYIQTDASKLRQVLINLLGNALKFTEMGGVTLRVKQTHFSTAPTPHSHLRFEVEDTGPGIDPTEIYQLFSAFGQTEAGRKSQQGTGLGLAISQKFVQLMGGEIEVHSRVGSGSLFSFTIQANLAYAQDIPSDPPRRKIKGLAPHQPKYRLLAVDDRLESRLILVKLLTQMGFEVKEADNGKAALALWQAWQPHLIWMDMQMPEMDGYEATHYIKATPQGQSTVIIALTASAFEEDRNIVLSAGCDDFMRKPFREESLWQKLEQHLGVQFIHDNLLDSDPFFLEKGDNHSQAHIHQQLSQLSADASAQLRQAAIACNDEEILGLIDHWLPANSELAIALRDLANNFLFEPIIELLERQETA